MITGRFLPPDFFIKQNIAKLEKNLLHMSEEQINDHLKELYKLTKPIFFETAILNKLLKQITKKKQYYHTYAYGNVAPKNILCTSSIKIIHDFLYWWYHPKYKKYYEKLFFIEKKLEQKIDNLRKKYALENKKTLTLNE